MLVRLPVVLLASAVFFAPLQAQTLGAPTVERPTATTPRPIPGPVFETPGFTRAVEAGTRTRTGVPGPRNWVQRARYAIDAALDPVAGRVSGTERVTYLNHSPDTLGTIFVYLRQNVFAPGSPRRDPAPITGGVTLTRVAVNGQDYSPPDTSSGMRRRQLAAGTYLVQGTVMRVPLATPLLPGDSVSMAFAWSYAPAPKPADGREGREGNVFFMGYWYPQVAVYDDVSGWVTDPYLAGAEFYMDPADYDVQLTVPYGWTVGATGSLANPEEVLTAAARDSLRVARTSGRVIRMFEPGSDPAPVFRRTGATSTWHFRAPDVRDFAWGASNEQAWDATRALVKHGGTALDTVDIHSFFRLTNRAAAWNVGGARFTRDAIEALSATLWPYPWPTMSSVEGILTGGGMEYPMMTVMQPWADTLSLAGDLMHETGHMWFPMMVGSNETRHVWMDEGLTQYDVAQGMKLIYGAPRTGGRPNDSEEGQRQQYLLFARAGADNSLMVDGDRYPPDRYMLNYNKTAQVLVALRSIMGPERFHDALVAYGHAWTDRHPEPFDFFNAMNTAAGKDLSWFWQTWFYHGWPLDQAIESVTTSGDTTTITVLDRGSAPMPVRLRITHADGTVENLELPVRVWLGGSRTRGGQRWSRRLPSPGSRSTRRAIFPTWTGPTRCGRGSSRWSILREKVFPEDEVHLRFPARGADAPHQQEPLAVGGEGVLAGVIVLPVLVGCTLPDDRLPAGRKAAIGVHRGGDDLSLPGLPIVERSAVATPERLLAAAVRDLHAAVTDIGERPHDDLLGSHRSSRHTPPSVHPVTPPATFPRPRSWRSGSSWCHRWCDGRRCRRCRRPRRRCGTAATVRRD